MRKVIPTRMHGVLDYSLGAFLMALPWMMGFANDRPETIVPAALGASIILYSLFTDYELSIFKVIPIKMHLRLDFLGGLFLAASPWLFHFNDYIYLPHVILGLFEIATVIETQTQPHSMEGRLSI